MTRRSWPADWPSATMCGPQMLRGLHAVMCHSVTRCGFTIGAPVARPRALTKSGRYYGWGAMSSLRRPSRPVEEAAGELREAVDVREGRHQADRDAHRSGALVVHAAAEVVRREALRKADEAGGELVLGETERHL